MTHIFPRKCKRLGIEKVDLDELLGRADFITIHTLTDATRNIISADALNKTKKACGLSVCTWWIGR